MKMHIKESERLCVFGYGSLIWKPNFTYNKRSIGYITGYLRRFFQGNTQHRGTTNQPGRVATLVHTGDADSRVWGCVYEIVGKTNIQIALDSLIEREVVKGGYKFDRVPFHPFTEELQTCQSQSTKTVSISPNSMINSEGSYEVLFHLSDPEVDLYLGDDSLDVQASQIVSAYGSCGSNSEYVLLLAAFMRTEVPMELALKDDSYIFELESLIREKLCLPAFAHGPPQEPSQDSIQTNTEVVERRRSSAREVAELHLLRRKYLSVD